MVHAQAQAHMALIYIFIFACRFFRIDLDFQSVSCLLSLRFFPFITFFGKAILPHEIESSAYTLKAYEK